MSGIMTSSNIASGCSCSAKTSPACPELAVKTFQPATVSKQIWATSRIYSSLSITKMHLAVIAYCSLLGKMKFFKDWESNIKGATFTQLTLNPDVTRVLLYYASANCQTQTSTLTIA